MDNAIYILLRMKYSCLTYRVGAKPCRNVAKQEQNCTVVTMMVIQLKAMHSVTETSVWQMKNAVYMFQKT